MLDALKDFYEVVSIIDLIYLIITTLSLIKCYRKGFVLSLLAASKWILSLGMILGRLELFAILVLFLPSFWRN